MVHHNNTPKLLCQMSDNGGFKRMSHPNRIKKGEKKVFFFKSAVVPHLNLIIPQMHYTFLMYESIQTNGMCVSSRECICSSVVLMGLLSLNKLGVRSVLHHLALQDKLQTQNQLEVIFKRKHAGCRPVFAIDSGNMYARAQKWYCV